MKAKVKEVIAKLKDDQQKINHLAVDLFSIIDPDRTHYKELIWLAAMPETLREDAYRIFNAVIDSVTPKEMKLSELLDNGYDGIMFEILETGESYVLNGICPVTDRISVKKLGSVFIEYMQPEIVVRRRF